MPESNNKYRVVRFAHLPNYPVSRINYKTNLDHYSAKELCDKLNNMLKEKHVNPNVIWYVVEEYTL